LGVYPASQGQQAGGDEVSLELASLHAGLLLASESKSNRISEQFRNVPARSLLHHLETAIPACRQTTKSTTSKQMIVWTLCMAA
jgi:hypothetical protein